MTGNFVFPRNAFLGFDHIFDALQDIHVHANDGYPPHNVVKITDGKVPAYSIEMAVAGFSKKDINIESEYDSIYNESMEYYNYLKDLTWTDC